MKILFKSCVALTMGLALSAAQTLRADVSAAIESGAYLLGVLSTNAGQNAYVTYFFTHSNDTVILRAASSDDFYRHSIPRRSVYFPSNYVSNPDYGLFAITESEADMVITNIVKPGWWKVICTLPTPLLNISNTFTYSISMLRMVDYPLSIQDLDVGTIHNGQSLDGAINVSADLDAAFFEVTNRCTVQIRMGQKYWPLVPNLQLYNPNGNVVSADLPPEYRAEITAVLTNPGVYTIVCADKFADVGEYSLSIVRIPGELSSEDPDVGWVASGDSIMGTINQPGDLDLASFHIMAGDIFRLSMRDYEDADAALNPRLELYNPTGELIAKAADPFQYKAVITHTAQVSGVYYAICKDSEDRSGIRYLFSFDILSGPSLTSIPPPPTNVVASQGAYPTYIMLSWDPLTNATGYDVYRFFGTNQITAIATNVPTASFMDYGVTTNRLYTYKIKSRNSFGTSALSLPAIGYCYSDFIAARRRAILVGLDNYSPDYPVSPLYKCIADARGIRDTMLLADPHGRWAEGAIQMLTDQSASKAQIREMLALQAKTATNGDLVLYTQSSHGGQNSGTDTYLCMYDASYTDAELAADLALFSSEVNVVVIADTCHSGGLFKDPDARWPFARRVMEEYQSIITARYQARGETPPKDIGRNIAFMTACDYNELSFESVSNGLYTGFLLQGCGLTAVDTNRDGEYQFLELHAHAEAKLLTNSPMQHAQSHNNELLGACIARARGSGGGVTNRVIRPECDYNGDHQSDLAVYAPASGAWFIYSLRNGPLAWSLPWGGPGMIPVSGDFNGDNITDLAVYELNTGYWHARSLTDGPAVMFAERWGGRNMMPVAADYDGDAISDLAVYDLANGYWYIRTVAGTVLLWGMSFTGPGFVAVPGDYDGDGIADLAHYHLATGTWIINKINGNIIVPGLKFGAAGMLPVSGDFNGDGINDLAVYEPASGFWYIRTISGTVLAWQAPWGGATLAAVPGDFDGDGASDMAVYDGYTGGWYIWSLPEQYLVLWHGLWGGYGFLPPKPNW